MQDWDVNLQHIKINMLFLNSFDIFVHTKDMYIFTQRTHIRVTTISLP